MIRNWKSKSLILACGFCVLAGCNRALVYGERSGFNLSVRTDTAEGNALEVNSGLQRRVVGFVPARGKIIDGKPKGEAVNMLSSFDLKREEDTAGPFDDKIAVRTVFLSGQAAVVASNKTETTAAIAEAPALTLTDDPAKRAVINKLFTHVGKSQANAEDYLRRAVSRNLTIPARSTPNARALAAIALDENAAGNRAIAAELNL